MGLQDVTNEELVHSIYTANDGLNYIVRLKKYRSAAGGFKEVGEVGAPSPIAGYLPGNIKMREIALKVTTGVGNVGPGRRERLPYANQTGTPWTTGGTLLSVDGQECVVIGRTGEKTKFL